MKEALARVATLYLEKKNNYKKGKEERIILFHISSGGYLRKLQLLRQHLFFDSLDFTESIHRKDCVVFRDQN